MDNKKAKIIVLILLVVFLSGGAYLLYSLGKPESPKDLSYVEVKEYQGKNLSSINDFRENSIKGPQHIEKESYRLKISGLTDGEKSLTYDEIINNHQSYKKLVTLDCVEGWRVTILWEGILIRDLFDKNNIPSDANTMIFHAVDGYTTSFPISYILDKDIIIADKMNGVALPPERGFPFQLVAEDKWGYKWIKWITEIEFSNDANYKGYWESRGYSNSGDLDKSFIQK